MSERRKITTYLIASSLPVLLPTFHILSLYIFWPNYYYKVDKKRCRCNCWDTVFKDTQIKMVKSSFVPSTLALCTPIIIPTLHIFTLKHFWSEYAFVVNKTGCDCSCWDTIFKGPYERGIARYKHFYFNATVNTFKIWLLTIVGIIVLYESSKFVVKTWLSGNARKEFIILFIASLFPHYYSWWGYINYYNDSFYSQWYHQLFFTVTEFLATYAVLRLIDYRNDVTYRKVLLVFGISLVHIYASGIDQFIYNVIWRQGHMHQVIRDYCLMIPDLLHVAISFKYLVNFFAKSNLKQTSNNIKKDLVITFVFVVLSSILINYL